MQKSIVDILCSEGRDSQNFSASDLADYSSLFGEELSEVWPEDQLTRIARLTREFTKAEFAGDQITAKRYFDLIREFISGRTKNEGQ